MNPGATTRPPASIVSRPRGLPPIARIFPPCTATARPASSPDSGSITRPCIITTSYTGALSGLALVGRDARATNPITFDRTIGLDKGRMTGETAAALKVRGRGVGSRNSWQQLRKLPLVTERVGHAPGAPAVRFMHR